MQREWEGNEDYKVCNVGRYFISCLSLSLSQSPHIDSFSIIFHILNLAKLPFLLVFTVTGHCKRENFILGHYFVGAYDWHLLHWRYFAGICNKKNFSLAPAGLSRRP